MMSTTKTAPQSLDQSTAQFINSEMFSNVNALLLILKPGKGFHLRLLISASVVLIKDSIFIMM